MESFIEFCLKMKAETTDGYVSIYNIQALYNAYQNQIKKDE